MMLTEFDLWMRSLDAEKLAATESFHCEAHRKMLADHALAKAFYMLEHNESRGFDDRMATIGQMWERRDTPKKPAKRVSVSYPSGTKEEEKYTFTAEQMAVAERVFNG